MNLNILLIFKKDKEEHFLKNTLLDLGHNVKTISTDIDGLVLKEISDLKPNIVIIYEEEPQQSILTTLRSIQNKEPSPIIVFADFCNNSLIGDAVDAGATAFILDGIEEHRIPAIIDASIARFNKCQTIKKLLTDAELKLEEKTHIEKA